MPAAPDVPAGRMMQRRCAGPAPAAIEQNSHRARWFNLPARKPPPMPRPCRRQACRILPPVPQLRPAGMAAADSLASAMPARWPCPRTGIGSAGRRAAKRRARRKRPGWLDLLFARPPAPRQGCRKGRDKHGRACGSRRDAAGSSRTGAWPQLRFTGARHRYGNRQVHGPAVSRCPAISWQSDAAPGRACMRPARGAGRRSGAWPTAGDKDRSASLPPAARRIRGGRSADDLAQDLDIIAIGLGLGV